MSAKPQLPRGWTWPDLRDYLPELAGLDPQSAHGAVLRPQVTLSSTATSDTDSVDVSSEFDFVAFRVVGLFGYNDLPSEPVTVGGHNHNAYERSFVKTQNVTVDLDCPNTRLKLVEEPLILAQIMPGYGVPIEFAVPHVLPRGAALKAAFALRDTTGANMVGAASTFGVRGEGVYVRTRPVAKDQREEG